MHFLLRPDQLDLLEKQYFLFPPEVAQNPSRIQNVSVLFRGEFVGNYVNQMTYCLLYIDTYIYILSEMDVNNQ